MLQASLITAVAVTLTGWQPTYFRWNPGELPIPYCITANGTRTSVSAAGQRAAVVRAINGWRSTGVGGGLSCSLYDAVPDNSACSPQINLRDDQPNIFWESQWTQGSNTLGVTHYTGGGNCGMVNGQRVNCTSDGDIELNDATTTWDDAGRRGTDIQSIMAHEYGHFIGLGHCNENNTCSSGTAVMYAAYPGGQLRVPFPDDVTGACTLYPGQSGGIGFPCTSNNGCNQGICVNAGNAGYCSEPCGTCPQGYACDANPTNPAQNICVRDDGSNRDLCEECSFGLPNACANSGVCLTGIPEAQAGRCATPCPNPNVTDGACAANFTCVRYSFQGGGSGFYCIPKSRDCTNLTNFTELDLGQQCSGDPPCKAGLTCIGMCSQQCNQSPDNCPNGFACESFNFQSGAQNWCATPVAEGQNCDGLRACPSGPCLLDSAGAATCYQDCTNNAAACNNAQQCVNYTVGGQPVGLCEPPGVPPLPPRPDSGIHADSGSPPFDSGTGPRDAGVGADGGPVGGYDARPGGGGTVPQFCACDQYFYCEAECACDLECPCACDQTYACDLDESGSDCSCDPECHTTAPAQFMKAETGGGGICAHMPSDDGTPWAVVLLLLGAFAVSRRRF